MAFHDYVAGEIAQDCADGLFSRREALRRLALLGVAAGPAAALLAACGDDGDGDGTDAGGETTPTTPVTDPAGQPSTTAAPGGGAAETIRFEGPAGELIGALAAPPGGTAGAVLVVHENRGLTPHFFDLTARLAADGYAALAVDLLSGQGGTDALGDEGAAQSALAAAPVERLVADLRAGIDELERRVPGAAVGTVGFCFGGGMVWHLLAAGEDRLAAAAPFYGPLPAGADFSRAQAAVYAVYAELDSRVNASRDAAEAALRAAGLTYTIQTFPAVDHAFFNDTGQRYDAEAAAAAYTGLLDWFAEYLS